MLPITWVFDTFGFGATHFFISRKLCYTKCLVHLRTLFSSSFFSLSLRLRLYIIFPFYLLLSLAMHLSFSLKVVFLFILRLPEQIASSCSSTCNTCNTSGRARYDAARIDASLEDVVSSSQAPPSIHSHWVGCWVVPLRLGSPRRALTLILWASASSVFLFYALALFFTMYLLYILNYLTNKFTFILPHLKQLYLNCLKANKLNKLLNSKNTINKES